MEKGKKKGGNGGSTFRLGLRARARARARVKLRVRVRVVEAVCSQYMPYPDQTKARSTMRQVCWFFVVVFYMTTVTSFFSMMCIMLFEFAIYKY